MKLSGRSVRSGHDLVRFEDKISFLYADRCRIERRRGTVVLRDEQGDTSIPVASLALLLLGPGTRITDQAMASLAAHGCTVVWTGEHAVRFYACGTPQNRSSRLAEMQATAWALPSSRRRTARLMYLTRFEGEKVDRLSIQQLRGREGARVRRAYRTAAKQYDVAWSGRVYDPNNWSVSDPINQAISTANACLYGVCHAAITTLGLTPALGFIHTGHRMSLVYDIADLYKVEIAIPVAFRTVVDGTHRLESRVRHQLRDHIAHCNLLRKILTDLLNLFGIDQDEASVLDKLHSGRDVLNLWDPESGEVAAGVNYESDEPPGAGIEE